MFYLLSYDGRLLLRCGGDVRGVLLLLVASVGVAALLLTTLQGLATLARLLLLTV